MTGSEMINSALSLLGYTENSGNASLTQRTLARALPLLNLVYGDLRWCCELEPKKLKTLADEIELPEKAYDIFACGLAGYIANGEGDDNEQAFWAAEYAARKVKLSHQTVYKDTLPKVF